MFHNYFFLKRLAKALDQKLSGLTLLECFSQNKDELVLGFGDRTDQTFIKANLAPQVSLLDITEDFKRAKKNSVDLFPALIDQKITSVQVFAYERSFAIVFETGHQLIFKMHGSRSNILMTLDGHTIEIFRGALNQDMDLIPDELNKPEPTRADFDTADGEVPNYLPALGKEVRSYLQRFNYDELAIEEKWSLLSETISALETNPITVDSTQSPPTLTLLKPEQDAPLQFYDAIEATHAFYSSFTKDYYLNHSKNQLLKDLESKIRKTSSYLKKATQKLEEVKNQRSYEEIANIVMANLHEFKGDKTEAELFDFYQNTPIQIKIKRGTTPQKYAENLYRKSKNQKIEVSKIEDNILTRQAQLDSLLEEKENVFKQTDFKSLKAIKKSSPEKVRETGSHPYHYIQKSGFDIYIGKNARGNDELTTRLAHKNDLWLHAKDVAGSHVIIKNQKNGTVPSDILEYAAQLAAWYSKRKNDSLCPVIYTEKKYVRKIKGAPAGAVRVDRESVLLVEPKNHLN